ncbi:MAG: hypothetical protein ACRDLV_14750, partial [Solirubrobacteraceae bacterium]
MRRFVGLRLGVAALLVAAVPVTVAAAAPARASRLPNWAGPEIRASLTHGLFPSSTATSFRPNAALTRQTLAMLGFDLHQVLLPPPVFSPPPVEAPSPDPTQTDPTQTDPTATDPASTDPATTDPTSTDPTVTDPTVTDPTTTDPTATDPTATDPTTTDPT